MLNKRNQYKANNKARKMLYKQLGLDVVTGLDVHKMGYATFKKLLTLLCNDVKDKTE